MADSTHYVAHIKVEKVNKHTNTDRHSASAGAVTREVVETTNLTVKSGTLDGLKAKITAHTNLLDEEDL